MHQLYDSASQAIPCAAEDNPNDSNLSSGTSDEGQISLDQPRSCHEPNENREAGRDKGKQTMEQEEDDDVEGARTEKGEGERGESTDTSGTDSSSISSDTLSESSDDDGGMPLKKTAKRAKTSGEPTKRPMKKVKTEQSKTAGKQPATSTKKPPKKTKTAQTKKSTANTVEAGKKKWGGSRSDLVNTATILRALEKELPKGKIPQAEFDESLFGDDEESTTTMTDLLGPKAKRVRPSAAELRLKQGDSDLSRNTPKEQRKSDAELLQIGLQSKGRKNKDRWREAPYCWNAKGFLYDEYNYLTEQKDPKTGDHVWDNDLLWKFARDHKVETFATRQVIPGLITAKGKMRKRKPRQTIAQRDEDGRYIKDVPEVRRITEATRSQLIYDRQKEVMSDRTEGVQRMKKERKEFEEDAMKLNERTVATLKAGSVVNKVVTQQIGSMTQRLDESKKEVGELQTEVQELLAIRQGLIEASRRTRELLDEANSQLAYAKNQLNQYELQYGPLNQALLPHNSESHVNHPTEPESMQPPQELPPDFPMISFTPINHPHAGHNTDATIHPPADLNSEL